MIEKDYFMRLIKTFSDALNLIINGIENDDVENVKIQISQTYQLLGNSSDFFLDTNLNKLLDYFKNDSLKKISMIGELLYLDSLVQKNKESKKLFLKKSILLLEYYSSNSKEYIFGLNSKITKMEAELINL
jgi:hypothetical protein